MGRPPEGDRAMTTAERSARYRAKQKVILEQIINVAESSRHEMMVPVPAELKQRVDEAARKAGASVDAWVARCLEGCTA